MVILRDQFGFKYGAHISVVVKVTVNFGSCFLDGVFVVEGRKSRTVRRQLAVTIFNFAPFWRVFEHGGDTGLPSTDVMDPVIPPSARGGEAYPGVCAMAAIPR